MVYLFELHLIGSVFKRNENDDSTTRTTNDPYYERSDSHRRTFA